MKTVIDFLNYALETMNADEWVEMISGALGDGPRDQWMPVDDEDIPGYALPAWKDGDELFPLPPKWYWDADCKQFVFTDYRRFDINRTPHGKWALQISSIDGKVTKGTWYFDTAPDAFREAQKRIKEGKE